MSVTESQKFWLALKLVPRLASHIKCKLVDEYTLQGLFKLTNEQLLNIGLNAKQQQAINKPDWPYIAAILQKCHQYHIDIVCIDQLTYPQLVKQTHNPPVLLFTQGNQILLNKPQLAIVGSRSATLSANQHAKSFSFQLAQQGLVITSGLAIGIDSSAHRGALMAQGATIAVVATGLDIVYPARNRQLAADILANNGLMVSEYLPGSVPNPGCFPRRNRIITGMSLGTFVVEAKLKSGSLISARLALEQDRDVFALPGAINNPQTKGCHSLIKQGAILVDEIDDILTQLDFKGLSGLSSRAVKKVTKIKQQDLFIDPLLSNVDYEATSVDTVVSRSQLPIEEVLTRLMTLELRGLVTAVPGGYIKLS